MFRIVNETDIGRSIQEIYDDTITAAQKSMFDVFVEAVETIGRTVSKNVPVGVRDPHLYESMDIISRYHGVEKLVGIVKFQDDRQGQATALDLGRRPGPLPFKPILEWVEGKLGGDMADAVRIWRSIARDGTKPAKFMEKSEEEAKVILAEKYRNLQVTFEAEFTRVHAGM